MAASVAQSRLPGIKTLYDGKFQDRSPDLRAAGKLTATGDSTQLCIRTPAARPESPEIIRRFRNTIRPDAGKTKIFYGKAYDPHLKWAASMTHGTCTMPSLKAIDLVNPPPSSLFQHRLQDKKASIYASHKRAPLATSHDQRVGLPNGLDPMNVTFGVRTEKDGCAGELVSPEKTRQQVYEEGELGRDLYRKTHSDYRVGEHCNRSYIDFNPTSKYGIPTPHANDGRHVRQTLKWMHDTQSEKAASVVSGRVDNFRERTQPQLGEVHDPIKDTMHVAPDHTFGILFKPDEYGVGDLMHGRGPGDYIRGKDRVRGVIAAMRQHLKKANYHNFHDLMAAFRHYDKDCSGKIDITGLRSVCQQFHLPTEPELMEHLMDYCDYNQDGQIDYEEFANFLNWKEKLPSGRVDDRLVQSAPAGPSRFTKHIDQAVGQQNTSSSMINAVVGGFSTQGYRNYGIPTIRTDLPAPRIKRVSDRVNYGDESDAHGLVNPSIYSAKGVNEKDFLIPRTRAELRTIFQNIGTKMDEGTFQQIYDAAKDSHPRGHVSVETFRNILDQIQGAQFTSSSGISY